MTKGHNGNLLSTEASRRFRRVAAQFATGVAVVTSVAEDIPVGTTVNAFATVSLEPTLLLVCLRHGSRLLDSIERSGTFAATILAADQLQQAQWFANRARPPGAMAFAGIPVRRAPVTGCLLLAEGLAYFDCRVRDVFPGGDHAVVIGEVAACDELWPREPLVFLGGEYLATNTRGPHGRQRLDHWVTPVGSAAVSETGDTSAGGSSAGSGLSTSATAWAVTTRR